MLTVEITGDSNVVELHGDSAGLLALAGLLTELATRQAPDHANVLSDEWGGNLLTSQAQNEGSTVVHHFKIMLWPRSRDSVNE